MGLLLLALLGFGAPAAVALASSGACCPGMEMAHEDCGSAAPCQWVAPTSCCDEPAAVSATPPLVPPDPPVSIAPAPASNPRVVRAPAAPSAPSVQQLSLATIVLRL